MFFVCVFIFIFEENFNWLLLQSPGIASDYMKSLLSFLKNMLDSFNHLPVKQLRINIHYKHLAKINVLLLLLQ